MYKQILAIALAATLLTLVTVGTMTTMMQVEAKKPVKPVTCKAPVKIQVGIDGVQGNDTLVGVVVLGGISKSKTIQVDENETFAVMNFLFKKMTTCPAVGDPYSGFINGTDFSGTLKSLKKPNTIKVEIS